MIMFGKNAVMDTCSKLLGFHSTAYYLKACMTTQLRVSVDVAPNQGGISVEHVARTIVTGASLVGDGPSLGIWQQRADGETGQPTKPTTTRQRTSNNHWRKKMGLLTSVAATNAMRTIRRVAIVQAICHAEGLSVRANKGREKYPQRRNAFRCTYKISHRVSDIQCFLKATKRSKIVQITLSSVNYYYFFYPTKCSMSFKLDN